MKPESKGSIFLDPLSFFPVPHKRALIATLAVSCSMALVACGGSGGGVAPVSKTAELSLAVGTIETFNGTGAQARISDPDGIAVDSAGNTYLTQSGLHSVRKISPAGVVTVFAGDAANSGAADGAGAEARFSKPSAIGVDRDNNIYVLDTGNYTIRKISPSGLVSTIAGSAGVSGTVDGKGAEARFSALSRIAVDPTGGVFVWEYGIGLRKITLAGEVVTLAVPLDILLRDIHLAADTGGNLFIASGTASADMYDAPVPLLHKRLIKNSLP